MTVRARPPKSAVVSIKSKDEAQSYANILKRARERINLGELGIKDPKVRFAANGGVLVEIPGPEGSKMANTLAEKLSSVMGEEYRISCPVKFGELRVSGIDPSVGPEELTLALCGASGGLSKDFRLGPIRRNLRGNQMVWVECPLGAAVRLAEMDKIGIGWSSVRIELLKSRPVQCFKCWHYDHVRGSCKASVDRSERCFGCGDSGHSVSDCSASPVCVVCRDTGLLHKHRLGSTVCGSLTSASVNRFGKSAMRNNISVQGPTI